MEGSTINLKHYVSVMSHLCLTASTFAKECAENPNLGKYDKGGNDPVTDVFVSLSRLTTKYRPILLKVSHISFPHSELLERKLLTIRELSTLILIKLPWILSHKLHNLKKMHLSKNFACGLILSIILKPL